jgi:hypothetical protein
VIVGDRQAAGHKEAEKEMLKLDLWNEEFPSAQELIECSCGWGSNSGWCDPAKL